MRGGVKLLKWAVEDNRVFQNPLKRLSGLQDISGLYFVALLLKRASGLQR